MEPSPTRQRASRNASQEMVTKEMIDNTALQRLDNELAPMRAERASYGCSVSFNGYTDEFARSMLNATVTTPSGSMLESAMDTDNNKWTSLYLKERLKTVIMRVGVEDVVAVISDNAANCVAAGKMLEEDEELRVFSIPCGSDTLYLLLEDIGKLVLAELPNTLRQATAAGRAFEDEAQASGAQPSSLLVKGVRSMWRQSAPIVQQVLGGALRRILMDQDIPAATAFAQEQIQRLLSGQVQLWELVMTGGLWRITGSQVAQAALEASGAAPAGGGRGVREEVRGPHATLAVKLAQRDPGTTFLLGQRLPFILLA
ncbi:DNA polymerase delta catalytic subunit, partial [Haematococcus lacustris]